MNTQHPTSDFTDWLQTASGVVLQMRKAALSNALSAISRSRVSQCGPEEVGYLRKALGIPDSGSIPEAVRKVCAPATMVAPYGTAPFVGMAEPGTAYDLTVEASRDHPVLIEIAGKTVKVVVK